jgi:D-beta-D-heptose 7-phosphate kinase/D-beta-D-heptose 1-phosphate adenosyltransferase
MKKNDIVHLFQEIRGRRVLVVGDLMLDEFIWGTARRLAPEAPVPVVEVERETWKLGGAANVAANIRALGGVPTVLGVIGDDLSAELLKAEFKRNDLTDHGLLVDPDRPTTRKTRVMAHSHQVVRVDRERRRPVSATIEDAIIARFAELLPEMAAVAISDYDKGALTARILESVLEMAQERDLPVTLDPKLRNFPFYKPVTVITPNHHEAEAATHLTIENDESLAEVCRAIRQMLGKPNVLVTRGEAGMTLCDPHGVLTHIPAAAREVYDVTGAGDTVLATLTLALAAGAEMLDAAITANHAAGVVVAKLGTATASPEEIAATFE